jgi:hypothetical protein
MRQMPTHTHTHTHDQHYSASCSIVLNSPSSDPLTTCESPCIMQLSTCAIVFMRSYMLREKFVFCSFLTHVHIQYHMHTGLIDCSANTRVTSMRWSETKTFLYLVGTVLVAFVSIQKFSISFVQEPYLHLCTCIHFLSDCKDIF